MRFLLRGVLGLAPPTQRVWFSGEKRGGGSFCRRLAVAQFLNDFNRRSLPGADNVSAGAQVRPISCGFLRLMLRHVAFRSRHITGRPLPFEVRPIPTAILAAACRTARRCRWLCRTRGSLLIPRG